MGVGGQRHALATLALAKTQYPLYRRLGGPHSWSGWVWKISPPLGFDPRTVQPVASHYTDWAILAYMLHSIGDWTMCQSRSSVQNIVYRG